MSVNSKSKRSEFDPGAIQKLSIDSNGECSHMAHLFTLERNNDNSVYAEVPAAYIDLLEQHLTTALRQLQSETQSHPAAEEIILCLKVLEILKENFQASLSITDRDQ